MFSMLSFGEVLMDFLPSSTASDYYMPLPGGAPANVAVAFAKLGGKSYFAGGIGSDNLGSQLIRAFNQEGVDISYCEVIPDSVTAIVLVSLDCEGERSFSFYRKDTADMQYDLNNFNRVNWAEIGVFHFCSNTLTDGHGLNTTNHALACAHKNNVLVSFDVNLRQQLWHKLDELPNCIDAFIKKSDIIKLSKDEARYLAQQKGISIEEYVSRILTMGNKLVVVTDGANAIELSCSGFFIQVDVPKTNAVDTTAAGDSFIGSFLFYLSRHTSAVEVKAMQGQKLHKILYDATVFAAQCGAKTCQKKGAFAALPSIVELQ